jgi:hypothetical protein
VATICPATAASDAALNRRRRVGGCAVRSAGRFKTPSAINQKQKPNHKISWTGALVANITKLVALDRSLPDCIAVAFSSGCAKSIAIAITNNNITNAAAPQGRGPW